MPSVLSRTAALTARIPAPGVAVGCAFVALGALWWIGASVAFGVIAVGLALARGAPLSDPVALMPGALAGLSYAATGAGMVAIAVALALLTGRPLVRALGLGRPRWHAVAVALPVGLTAGLLPGWIAERLVTWMPALDLGALETISRLLVEGGPADRAAMALAVVVAAPVLEELVFRGFLWDALERSLPRWAVWLLTSVAFAAWHMDPVQGTAVLFTGLALGWLRWGSGSTWAPMVAHLANNALATGFALAFAGGAEPPMPGWIALAGALATVALASLAWLGRAPAGAKVSPSEGA